jgi:hypothetical protein
LIATEIKWVARLELGAVRQVEIFATGPYPETNHYRSHTLER